MLRMRLSERSDYALHALIELAGSAGGLVSTEQLARTQAIPGSVLEGIMTELRRAGLVLSQRGPQGGFCLARPAAEISLADVIQAINGPRMGGDTVHGTDAGETPPR
jgi:Rrf2 family protein